jgi:CDP-diacylglycerol--serine O-phosphatidyltransferase
MKIKQIIPNVITLMNILCGTMAVIAVFRWNLQTAACFIFAGALFDFFDGAVARLLHVSGAFGKELDSICDVVTFGVAPGMMAYKMMLDNSMMLSWIPFIALLIPILSAVRLAKFNLDVRQSSEFIGLPTPANALFFCGIPFVDSSFMLSFLAFSWTLPLLTLIFSLLLVCNFSLFSLKFKNLTWKGNKIRYVFLLFALLLILVLRGNSLSIIIISYILFSIVYNLIKK